MIEYALPPLAALLVWWAGTGAVLLLDRMPRDTAAWTFFAASLFTVAALLCIGHASRSEDVSGAYAGFICAVVLWGWHELAFLSGWITGPRRLALSPGARDMRRLGEAVQVLLWHEVALLATVALLWAWLWGRPQPIAAWTFTLLYAMRVSAKLNLFLGVRNLGLEFLSPRLGYIGSYFRHRRFNGLMPWSLLAAAVTAAGLVAGAASASGGARTGRLLLGSLLVLALVEHLLMVLPLQPAALWRWALRRQAAVVR